MKKVLGLIKHILCLYWSKNLDQSPGQSMSGYYFLYFAAILGLARNEPECKMSFHLGIHPIALDY